MNLENIKKQLKSHSIFFSEDSICQKPSVIGYEKKFKWAWLATQLNTFLVAVDFADEPVDVAVIEAVLAESFEYARQNYNGWPRGWQAGMAVISILISSQVSAEAIEYCRMLKADKKWAAFTVPVVLESNNQKLHYFTQNPLWGRIYYPHLKALIEQATQ